MTHVTSAVVLRQVNEVCVWTGDPGDLSWGGDSSEDPLCTEAVNAVTAAL